MANPQSTDQLRSTLARALKEIERLRKKIAGFEDGAAQPVAVVGLGLRLPGGAVDLDRLWTVLDQQIDAVAPIPDSRWNASAFYDPDPEATEKAYVREAAFLDQIDQFDPAFFNISPREAKNVDPQHRLLLEASWEALETAGIPPTSLVDSKAGVFVGIGPSDYASLGSALPADAYGILGTHPSFAAGRIAFSLGLQGPAISLDTACSSSLVALHLAVHSLRAKECSLALAGGVQVLAAPDAFVRLSRTRALAADGRCKTFSANADGYGRGEGVVVLALERLSDALANHRSILAVIRGSAVNHDGRSSGITVPNGVSQQQVLRAALADAGLAPEDVDYVECHGTGTSLGDPIEVNALAAVYGSGRPKDRPLLLGALKANIGHLEAAAGIAGVAKVIASLRHQNLPASLHANPPNPHIDWPALPVAVVDRPQPWTGHERPRRAGVSGFGLSGTNAHVILEEAPTHAQPPAERPTPPDHLPLMLSARSPGALVELASRLREHPVGSTALVDLASSLLTSRSQFEHRAGIVVGDVDSIAPRLEAFETRGPDVVGVAKKPPRLAFLFTGQGAQRLGMGRALAAAYPAFRTALDEVVAGFTPYLDASLREVMFADEQSERAKLLDQTAYTQPALFALEVALFRLLSSWGLRPRVLLGHSIGELAAAHVAGVLGLDDACKLVAARGRLMQALPSGGAMLSIQASEAELVPLLEQHSGVDIAGLNGPLSTVISGDEEPIAALEAHFRELGRKTRRLVVSHAFHSHRMDPMLDEFRKVAESVRFLAPKLPIVSNVTGKLATAEELGSPDYWVRHVRQAVRFVDGVRTLEAQSVGLCLELGPHGVLCSMAAACLSDAGQDQVALLPTLRRDKPETEVFALALAGLHCHGITVDWAAYFEPFEPRRVELPTYPFQRQRCWLDGARQAASDVASAGLESTPHPLIGAALALAEADSFLFTARIALADHPWLADHVIFDHVLIPGTGLLDLALSAGAHVGAPQLDELSLEAPLALGKDEPRTLQLFVSAPDQSGRRSLAIHSRPASAAASSPWTRHASGSLSSAEAKPDFDLAVWPPPGASEARLDGFYDRLAQAGLAYGPSFQGLVRAWTLGEVRFAEVRLPDHTDVEGFAIHPALLDAALHALAIANGGDQVVLPFAWSGVSVHATGAASLRVRLSPTASEGSCSLEVADAAGQPVASIRALATRPASPADIRSALAGGDARNLYRVAYKPVPRPEPRRFAAVVQVGGPPLSGVTRVDSLDAITTSPELVLVPAFAPSESPLDASTRLLELLQTWLGDERFAGSRVVVITRRAIATRLDDDVLDLAHAPLWGLVRAAASEHTDRRLTLLDVDRFDASVLDALASDEPQLALRGDDLLVPRLASARSPDVLIPPASSLAWHLDTVPRGTLENLTFVDAHAVLDPLPPGHVRIRVTATGLNFRDVLNALGMYPGDPGPLGYEGAGIVTAVADDVTALKVGDGVFGLLRAGFASHSVVDHRLVTAIPKGWTHAQAASTPLVFLTAYYAFVDLAKLQAGERVLIHAATGGVGMAATQLARHLGAEVFGTGSTPKWPVLRELGFDDAHISNSRTLEFEADFLAATKGEGVDVVLDALAREFVDASLRLLPRGGRFLEMGKTDLRDPEVVAHDHPGVVYRAFDLIDAGPERIQEMLRDLVALFEAGALTPLPTKIYDLRRAPEAFRFVGQAKHVGKLVLTAAPSLDPLGTVLVTGGTGALGALVARHLVEHHDVRRLLLSSRRGPDSPGAAELQADLEALGAHVRIVASDVADLGQAKALLDAVAADHPLTAIIHTAGVLDDGLFVDLTRARLATVFAPKVDAASNLHQLSKDLPLAAFVLFSSVSGTLGSAAQANYAAANAFLDALCAHRQALGLPAQSLAWGPWASGGMAARLAEADIARMKRSGLPPIDVDEGLQLLDAALARPEPALVPVRIDAKALAERSDPVPRILASLVRSAPRRATAQSAHEPDLAGQLAHTSPEERVRVLLDITRREVMTITGIARPDDVPTDHPLQEFGLDSLMAVELRNRLQSATNTRLPATLLFDYPTARKIADLLASKFADSSVASVASSQPLASDEDLRNQIARIPIATLRERGLLNTLLGLVPEQSPAQPESATDKSIDEMSLDDLVNFALADEE